MHIVSAQRGFDLATIEVADLYACYLWQRGRHVEALAVWGESVLPWAPAAYWDRFISRLAKAGHLNLIVKWLPFNDRGRVAPSVYLQLLLDPLQKLLHEKFLSRVAKWPVLYTVDILLERVISILREQSVSAATLLRYRQPLEMTTAKPWVLQLTALYKCFEFSSRFIEAAQILLFCQRILNGRRISIQTDEIDHLDDEAHAQALRSAVENTQCIGSFDSSIGGSPLFVCNPTP